MLGLAPNDATLREVIVAVNQLIQGRNNATGSIELSPDATSTIVENPLVNAGSVIVLAPSNQAAATEGAYVSNVEPGRFTIQHSSGTAQRTYRYLNLGG